MPEEFLSANSSIKDPIIIDPPGYTADKGWQECQSYVESVGGPTHSDGEPCIMAAAGADPGCCTCPNCHQYFWAFGRRIRCTECGFEFPTDWWPMYSYGTQHSRRLSGAVVCPNPDDNRRMLAYVSAKSEEMKKHPYYRYGFDHPVGDPWEAHDKLPWQDIMGQLECKHEYEGYEFFFNDTPGE
jgi:hypothetical protein